MDAGYRVQGVFAGAGSYCDDLVLLAPTRSALQIQMSFCEDYARRHNLVFSTHPDPQKSKTKCVLFRLHAREEKPAKILLNGNALPWVDNAAHLEHELHTTGNQDFDCRQRRSAYIGQTTELLGIFQYAHPLQKLAAIQTYACALYGSNLWNLYGPAAGQMFKCWNVTVRDAWGVTRLTRTHIVDHLLSGNLSPIKQLVIRRYIRFVQGLVKSQNQVLSVLSHWAVNTVQSVTGLNVANIRQEFGLNPLLYGPTLFSVKKKDITEIDQNNMDLLGELLQQKHDEIDPDTILELDGLINNICQSEDIMTPHDTLFIC